jgi:hypothetical protein
MLGFSSNREAKPQCRFVISSWSYPDSYGQGICEINIAGNSTGSWVVTDILYPSGNTTVFPWNATVGIRINVYTYLNQTLTGAASLADGKRFQRHNVTVMAEGQMIWSQSNFTYYGSWPTSPNWKYIYYVTLGFLPVSGMTYTATITYEVFY